MTRRGRSVAALAGRLGVARTTVHEWIERWERDRGAVRVRGRPVQVAVASTRREVIGALAAEGIGVGVPALRTRFPDVARRELEELKARWAYALRRRRREVLCRLEWTRPGAVWAADFTQLRSRVDGRYERLLLVRDLASGNQLLAMPSVGERASEVVLALDGLIAEHGAPLVLKADNGPGFVAEATRDLCSSQGISILYSPPYTPSYNGACEAGVGSIKSRALRIAAAAGRAGAWTGDDVERARLQANECACVRGDAGWTTPESLWRGRLDVSLEERARFRESIGRHTDLKRRELEIADGVVPNERDRAIIDRAAITAALVEHDLLRIRRGRVAPLNRAAKSTRITG